MVTISTGAPKAVTSRASVVEEIAAGAAVLADGVGARVGVLASVAQVQVATVAGETAVGVPAVPVLASRVVQTFIDIILTHRPVVTWKSYAAE